MIFLEAIVETSVSLDAIMFFVLALALVTSFVQFYTGGIIYGVLAIFSWLFLTFQIVPDFPMMFPLFLGLIVINFLKIFQEAVS